MIATSHNMVHGALPTIIIHKKYKETNGCYFYCSFIHPFAKTILCWDSGKCNIVFVVLEWVTYLDSWIETFPRWEVHTWTISRSFCKHGLTLIPKAAVMTATSHNMVHGALPTIIIHKKYKETNGCYFYCSFIHPFAKTILCWDSGKCNIVFVVLEWVTYLDSWIETFPRWEVHTWTISRSFCKHGLTLIPAWISYHAPSKVWNEIIYPFPNFNGCTIEIWF